MKKTTVLLILATLTLGVFIANLGVRGPMVQAEEGAYLANAAAVAGYSNDLENNYHAGYSMMLAPAFWLGQTPQGVWITVKLINAILFALTVAGLWLTAVRLSPARDPLGRVLAVGLAALYPMWLVTAGYAFAQIAFVPVFLFMFLSYLQAISGGMKAWVSLGVLSGLLYWIHPLAVAPILAVVTGGAYVAVSRRSFGLFAMLLLSIVLMVLVYRFGLDPWLNSQMNMSGLPPVLADPGLLELIASQVSFDGLHAVITHMAGQLFYLSAGTVGLLWLGLFALIPWTKDSVASDQKSPLKRPAIALFAGISLFGVIGLSALLNASVPIGEHRLDHWISGRYAEGVIAPLLLLGALTPSFRKIMWVIPIAVLCAMVLWIDFTAYTHAAPFNIPAFWQDFWLRESGLWTWLAAACGLFVLVALPPKRIGMLIMGLVFVYSAYLQLAWHKTASEGAVNRWNAALQIREHFEPGTCVGFEPTGIDSHDKRVFWFDFGFVLFDYQMERMNAEEWNEKCDGPFLSYQDEPGLEDAEVYPLALSHRGGPEAWARGLPPAGFQPISWDGEAQIASQVGHHTGSGMQSDGRAGYLIYGPYEPIMAGSYEFQITGRVESGGNEIEVDVSDIRSGKTFARYKGLGNLRGSNDSRLLKSRITLRNDVSELEVRVHVEEEVDVYIDGYSLKLIAPDGDASLN